MEKIVDYAALMSLVEHVLMAMGNGTRLSRSSWNRFAWCGKIVWICQVVGSEEG